MCYCCENGGSSTNAGVLLLPTKMNDGDEILELSFGAGRSLFRVPLSKCIPCSLDFEAERRRDLERHKNGHKRFGKDAQGGDDRKNTKKRSFEDIYGKRTSPVSEQSDALILAAQIAEGETAQSDDIPVQKEQSTNQKPPAEITLHYAPEDTEKKYGYDVSDDTIAAPPDFPSCIDPTPWSELTLPRRISRIRQYAIYMRRTTKKTDAGDISHETAKSTKSTDTSNATIVDKTTTATSRRTTGQKQSKPVLYYAPEDKEKKYGFDLYSNCDGPPKYPGCNYKKNWTKLRPLQRMWRVREYVNAMENPLPCGPPYVQELHCPATDCEVLSKSAIVIPPNAFHGMKVACPSPQCKIKKPRYCVMCNKLVSSSNFAKSHENEEMHYKKKSPKSKKSGDEKKVSKPAPQKWNVKRSISGKSSFIGTFASTEEADVAHAVVDIFASHDTRPLRCQGLSPDALSEITKSYAMRLAKDSRMIEAVRNRNAHLVVEAIQKLEKEKARTDYDYLSKLLTKLDAANHTSPIQWEHDGTVFAMMPAFSFKTDVQVDILQQFNCVSSAEFFGNLLRLGFEDIKGDTFRWRHPYFQRGGYQRLMHLELFQRK